MKMSMTMTMPMTMSMSMTMSQRQSLPAQSQLRPRLAWTALVQCRASSGASCHKTSAWPAPLRPSTT
jgi:hypothetical protein